MEAQLTNLKNFLATLPHYNNVDTQRKVAIDTIKDYIEALFGHLTASETAKLDRLLYEAFRAFEDKYGRTI